jgi:5,10-methylenetetrahydrofolate reductase
MHLTCTNMSKNGDPVAAVHDALQSAHDAGIRNIVALRGDPPAGEEEWTAVEGGFSCALDLVKYIRKQFGQEFGIAVAGYPEGHPNAITELKEGEAESLSESEKTRCSEFDGKMYVCKDEDYKKEMDYLKEKVDAGSGKWFELSRFIHFDSFDSFIRILYSLEHEIKPYSNSILTHFPYHLLYFISINVLFFINLDIIITQMFFDVEVYKTFVKDCRKWGIECPIIPGLMCINAYPGFKKMTKFCKTRVPKDLEAKMDSMKDDAAAVKAFGVEFGAEVCQSLMDFGTEVLHFYTLNLEKVVYGITDALGLTKNLVEKSNESDAKSMVAVGSAWARVGDRVKSIYGEGIVKEIRKGGEAVIEMLSWELAGGQRPTAFLQKANYSKV